MLTQYDTPIHHALEEQRLNRLAHFDVPGHKGGRGNRELKEFLGADCVMLDMNSMKPYLSIDEQGLKMCSLPLLFRGEVGGRR